MLLKRIYTTLVILSAVLNAGCNTLADARAAKGAGMSRIYEAPFDTVWKVIPQAVKESGLDLVSDNRQEGYVLAQRGISLFSYGENVAIFVEDVVRAAKTKVEVVSKKAMETNIFAPSWEKDILDRIGEKVGKVGNPIVKNHVTMGQPDMANRSGVDSLLNKELRQAHPPTGFAEVSNVEAVPRISERCRDIYRAWIARVAPKGFAVGTGACGSSSGVRPPKPDLPIDPAERALAICESFGKGACKLYAIDDAVVWKP
jgi:predicted small secreted protein